MNKLSISNQLRSILNKMSNEDLNSFARILIEFVRENDKNFMDIADDSYLDFIRAINPPEYFIGKTGDDFRIISNGYLFKGFETKAETWRIASTLIWDLISYESEVVCPHCLSDQLRIYKNTVSGKTVFSCETCFYSAEDGIEIKRPDTLVPASRLEIQNREIKLPILPPSETFK